MFAKARSLAERADAFQRFGYHASSAALRERASRAEALAWQLAAAEAEAAACAVAPNAYAAARRAGGG